MIKLRVIFSLLFITAITVSAFATVELAVAYFPLR
jgi:hypothetical protein